MAETCFICKKEITQAEINKVEGIVQMIVPNGSRSYVHLSHRGISEEYDRQLGVKKTL